MERLATSERIIQTKSVASLADEQLSQVIGLIGARIPYESLYLYGSRAQGTATEKSDYDLLMVVKTGLYFAHYARLFRLERSLKKHFKKRVDLHVACASFMGRSRIGLPVRFMRRNVVLVSGRRSLPEPERLVDPVSYRLTVALPCLDILLHMRLTTEGFFIKKEDLRKAMLILEVHSQLLASYGNVAGLVARLKALGSEDTVNIEQLCATLSTFLQRNFDGLRFSHLDLFLYIFLAWVKRRKRILLGTLINKRHATERILEAQILLTQAAVHYPPEGSLLRRISRLLYDHVNRVNLEDPCKAWYQLRDVVASYWFPAVETVRFTRDSWYF